MSSTQTSEMTSSSSLENETVTMTSSSTTSSQSLENDTTIATSHSPENVTITAFDSQTSQSEPTTRPEVTTVSSSASTSFGLTTSNSTNSSIEGLIPRMIPRNIPKTTQKPPSLTTSTRANPRASTSTHSILPCNPQTPKRDGLVSQCLIAIAVLAGVATIFMVCTIVLCTKLSSNKQRYRVKEANGTELVCISALLPDGSNSYRSRPKTQKSNGALFPTTDDSEGDDLTLHSFLPDHS
ncbi:SELPL protein, partial [Atractosteus spatula]|nr:SELPL protein [Atractosteus spatula]